MASYHEKVAADLDRWIAAGLAPKENRAAMLAMLPAQRRVDAATALAWVGGVLLGVAAIAFIAANWDGIARLARFAILLFTFAAAAGAAAWASHKERELTANVALTIATLLFAACIGLTGQIFDIAGEPKAALRGAGIAGFALALAGRSTGAAVAALALTALGDFSDNTFWSTSSDAPWLIVAAPLCVALSLWWTSAALAHASAVGVLLALVWFQSQTNLDGPLMLLFSVALFGTAAGSRALVQQGTPHASTFYGWSIWGALMFFALAGIDAAPVSTGMGVAHRLAWLALSGGAIALGRFDRHLMITGIGVLSFMGAVSMLLADLGLNLLAAAGLFFACALAALVGGLLLRNAKQKGDEA